jgi:hypothetical protein
MATPTLPVKATPSIPEEPTQILPSKLPASGEPAEASNPRPAAPIPSPEPSPEEVLARLLAKAGEPEAAAPLVDVRPASSKESLLPADRGLQAERPATEGDAAKAARLPPLPMPSVGPADTAERRPLSVRSFASAIQGRQAATESAAAVSRPEARVAMPPVPTEAPAPAAILDETPSAQFVTPVTASAQAMPSLQPATSWDDEEDDLEDFLSAQLDDDLGEDIWNAKEAPEVDPPTPPIIAPAIVAAPVAAAASAAVAPTVAPPAQARRDPPSLGAAPIAEPVRNEAAPRRQLTLEEEMERLLGDFDLETADRRSR